MATPKMTTSRYNDFLYDPLFVVSGEKDYYKAAMISRMSSAKFALCPDFPNMFSDLPHRKRQHYLMRKAEPIPPYEEILNKKECVLYDLKPADVGGSDRHKFFANPIVNLKLEIREKMKPKRVVTTARPVEKRTKKIQTQYRESEAQTTPWEPPYYIVDGSDPELLMLDFLKWGSGLPAGMHEVRLIERARMKRAWEKSLPPITGPKSLEDRRKLIEAMERDEWAFRDQEIQDIQDLRLEFLQEMLCELLKKSKTRTEMKMESFVKVKEREKEEKIRKLHHHADRELRKIRMKQAGVNFKFHHVDVVEEHRDPKSELYGPLMRYGEHPKRWHQVIDEHLKKYRAQFMGVEHFSTLPRWLDTATKMKDCVCVKLPGTRLCIRETKWTSPVLKELHEELKNLRKKEKRDCKLVRIEDIVEEIIKTPTTEPIAEFEEELHQAVVLIESVLRGRASQMLIFEGRDRCRELIQELRTTHALQEEDKIKKFKNRLEVKSQQRAGVICKKNTSQLQENLSKLSGTVVGTLLDFLNKELRRLLEERRGHAMCLLYERERHRREAAEAGRRQKELRRQREHDEMFKQVVKVHQDTVDVYLQDIITEGMEFVSKEQATKFVEDMAYKIDDNAYSTMNSLDFNDKEQLIAQLVHNFLLPEVEKKIVRDNIKKKQRNYLGAAREEIYRNMEHLPKPRTPQSSCVKSIEEAELEPVHPCVTETKKLLGLANSTSSESTTSVTIDIAKKPDLEVIYTTEKAAVVQAHTKERKTSSIESVAFDDSASFLFSGFSTAMEMEGTDFNLLQYGESASTIATVSTVQKQVTPESMSEGEETIEDDKTVEKN